MVSSVRYIVVGAVNTVSSFVIFPIIYALFDSYLSKYLVVTISHITCLTVAFALHKIYTFANYKYSHGQLVKYYVSQFILYMLNMIALAIFATSHQYFVVQYITTAILVVVNYFVMYKFVFGVNDAVRK